MLQVMRMLLSSGYLPVSACVSSLQCVWHLLDRPRMKGTTIIISLQSRNIDIY